MSIINPSCEELGIGLGERRDYFRTSVACVALCALASGRV